MPIVAEEAASRRRRCPRSGARFLLVDPLDGTKEFISRNGEFTVNVALVEDGTPVAGRRARAGAGLAYAGSGERAWKGTIAADLRRYRRLDGDPRARAPARTRSPSPAART